MTDEETERTPSCSCRSKDAFAGGRRARHEVHRRTGTAAARKEKIVTVLHEGSVLAEGALADVQSNERVVEVYLGPQSISVGSPVGLGAEAASARNP